MSIATIERVKSARKAQGPCGKCGTEINPGDPYKHISVGFRGRKQVRCEPCPDWRPSERESNDALSTAYAAQESGHDELDALAVNDDDGLTSYEAVGARVKEIVADVATGGEDARSAVEESFDNMPEGLQQGDTGQQLEERRDTLETWVSDLQDWEPPDAPEPDDENDESLDEYFDECVTSAREAIDALEA